MKILGILIAAFLIMGFAIVEPAKTMPAGLASIYALAMGLLLVTAVLVAIKRTITRAGRDRHERLRTPHS